MSGATREALFLVGETASGKSRVAWVLAERRRCGVLSADSMSVYRGMDIGTAKPDAAERGDHPCFGIDLVDPDATFSVWDYAEYVRNHAVEIWNSEALPIVVGGTGLYVKALLEGIEDRGAGRSSDRERWMAMLEEGGVEALGTALAGISPEWFAALADARNPRRVIRALELASNGARPPEKRAERETRVTPPIVGLAWERATLDERIRERVERMYERGLLDEARALRARFRLSATARQAIGYAEAFAALDGTLGVEEAKALTILRTRRLAKRQRTWFRGQHTVNWVSITPDMDVEAVADTVEERWREHGASRVRC